MAKNKKGFDRVEYPKIIRVEGILGKVKVMSEEEEAKYTKVPEPKKEVTWGKGKDK